MTNLVSAEEFPRIEKNAEERRAAYSVTLGEA